MENVTYIVLLTILGVTFIFFLISCRRNSEHTKHYLKLLKYIMTAILGASFLITATFFSKNVLMLNSNFNIVNNNSINISGNKSEEALLIEAQDALDDKNYEKAFSVYLSDELATNDVALVNKGFMYDKGLGVEANTEKAYQCYERTSHIQAKRNLAALELRDFGGDSGENNLTYFNELKEQHDPELWNYISMSKYGIPLSKNPNIDYDGEKIDFIKDFYDMGLVKLYNIPENKDGNIYVYKSRGVDNMGNNASANFYIYEKYTLKDMGDFEKMIKV